VPRALSRIAVDITPLRASRDLRLLVLGNVVSGLGTQAALVALPYQIYLETGSAFLTGLLGAVELVPLIAMALLGAPSPTATTVGGCCCSTRWRWWRPLPPSLR